MLTNGEFVSRVINDINALNKDSHISRRWILSIGRNKAESYIAQRWDEGHLILDGNIQTCVGCVKMVEVDKIDCCDVEFPLCSTLMRSEDKIPGLVYTGFGPIISSVSNVDNTIYYSYKDLRSYRNFSKRKYASKASKKFYIHDDYLYIPGEHIELINICYFTIKEREALALSSCNTLDNCKSMWDYDFIYPVKMIESIISETVREVSLKIQIPTDENPNMDLNQKTQLVN